MDSLSVDSKPGPARRVVAGTAALIGTIVWSHTLAALLRPLAPEGAPLAAGALTIAAVLVALAGIATWPRSGAPLLATLAGAAGALTIARIHPGTLLPALALVPVGAAVAWAGGRFAAWLPADLERRAVRHRVLAVLWLLVSLAGVAQIGRLSTYMTDHDFDWYLSTRHPFLAKHECANAYFYGAELNARGETNVYDPAHYPGLTPGARAETDLVGMTPDDPYQYAPQFLLWPTLAISVTHDYASIRMVWFGLQVALLMGVVLGLAAWIGGRAGRIVALWSPAMLIAFPTLHNLQYGQFHFAAVALGVLGLLALERGRRPLGAALLAVSILSKLFPAVLLVLLAAQRRWRDLGWTVAAMIALTVVSLAVVGPAPFHAFIDYQLPRLSNGQAFAFGEAWPELRELVITSNQGIFGLVTKLGEMGVPGASVEAAAMVGRIYSLALMAFAALAGLRLRGASRFGRATSWVALLGLGSLMSAGAFADYVPVTCVWLLILLLAKVVERPLLAAGLGVCAVLQFFILGTVPVGSWTPIGLMMPLSAFSVLVMLATFTWTVTEAMKGERAPMVESVSLAREPRAMRNIWEPATVPVRADRTSAR